MYSKFYNAFQLIRKGHFKILLKESQKRLYSNSISLGLQRDLNNDFEVPSAKIDIQIRPLKRKDVSDLLNTSTTHSTNPRIINNQLSIVNANIPTCYVAVTMNDKPCYMQWLIGYDDNKKIEEHFKGVFPSLKKHEALLEGAYSNPAYRGLGIMPKAMALIAKKAADIDVRWVNTFVDITNIPSLKGCQRSGFKPYMMRNDHWFLFHRTTTFHPLSESLKNKFYEVTDSNKQKIDDTANPELLSQSPEMRSKNWNRSI